MRRRMEWAEPLLTPGEVAAMFRVCPETVTRWANRGLLRSVRTLGGQRRFPEADVRALLARSGDKPATTGERRTDDDES